MSQVKGLEGEDDDDLSYQLMFDAPPRRKLRSNSCSARLSHNSPPKAGASRIKKRKKKKCSKRAVHPAFSFFLGNLKIAIPDRVRHFTTKKSGKKKQKGKCKCQPTDQQQHQPSASGPSSSSAVVADPLPEEKQEQELSGLFGAMRLRHQQSGQHESGQSGQSGARIDQETLSNLFQKIKMDGSGSGTSGQ